MLKLYKKIGETPLECLERLARENSKYKNVKMTYAGRLDPMAEGELLVLVGEECVNKEKYLGLDKEYEFEVLFGFETDTYDILGIPKGSEPFKEHDLSKHQDRIERFLESIRGKQTQKYPPFSSKTLDGKPLFELAKAGKLDESKLPGHEIEIYEADFIKSYWIKGKDLKTDIFKRISLVNGDFRQEEILKRWGETLLGKEEERFLISGFKVVCSSGTYIRGLVNSLGKKIGYPALTFHIKRTKIFS
jgi:tRNA pseudouridine55 synthase